MHWIARLFAMDDRTWDRHASPWSVWTRVASGGLPFLALHAHAWVGWPWALAMLAVTAVWLWLNPRLFAPPAHTDSWASKGTFGERVWLARSRVPIPPRHRRVPHLLALLASAGAAVGGYGAVTAQAGVTVAGVVVLYVGKLWFVDRMVWLYEDMKDADPAYRAWLR